ncbi:hypothetical protein DERF_005986 [Dermatophagoides farinae]|uniref:Uncharacterized protein n=1 Tax=Dermatophagoides farinae TaxID=6954 RepID=A0A922I4K6_DERFA|nr:hypothetical protein DERF_005986 [Dermatophagoides farinae]
MSFHLVFNYKTIPEQRNVVCYSDDTIHQNRKINNRRSEIIYDGLEMRKFPFKENKWKTAKNRSVIHL